MKIGETSRRALKSELARDGIGLRFGQFQFRLQSPIDQIVTAVHTLYADHPFRPPAGFSDFRMRLDPAFVRAKPYVIASVNGVVWNTWPKRLTVAAMEWICNWCFFRGAGAGLAIHAGAAVIPGRGDWAIVFPGASGAGKSTLSSTLMMSDWDLLSDEISLFDFSDFRLTALGRPTILKGHSLELITQRYGPRAILGPMGKIAEPKTPIAHLRPTESTVQIRGSKYRTAAIVFPNRQPDERPRLEPVSTGEAFSLISQFGINYRMLGRQGFDATIGLAKSCPAYRMTYGDAADAERFLRAEFSALPARKPQLVAVGAESLSPGASETGLSLGSTIPVRSDDAPGHAADSPPVDERDDASEDDAEACNDGTMDWWAKSSRSTLTQQDALNLVVQSLHQPEVLVDRTPRDWDMIVPLAQHLELLPRVAIGLSTPSLWAEIPAVVQMRLAHERQLSRFNTISVQFERKQLEQCLRGVDTPIVLLKGAAYLAAEFPWAEGRRTNDIDLLVSDDRLTDVESALRDGGYIIREDLAEADRRYYRRWLHELPPYEHPYRRMEIDIHFRLLPVGDPRTFSVAEMIQRSVTVGDGPFRILDRVDRVIHAVVNLAHTGEYRRGYRDLFDLRCLMSPLENEMPFDYETLVRRGRELRLGRPIALMLLLAEELVGLELPPETCKSLTDRSSDRIRSSSRYRLMRTASIPSGATMRTRARRFAMWAMEHYPLPRMRTWVDPLTWTKRIQFVHD